MTKSSRAARNIADEMNPITFWERIRNLPVLKQILRVLDRFL
jgi:hypothetical protein